MNYNEWGAQYLEQARALKEHLAPLQAQARAAGGETSVKLYRRVALLYEMYLECLHTGNCLVRRGGGQCEEKRI